MTISTGLGTLVWVFIIRPSLGSPLLSLFGRPCVVGLHRDVRRTDRTRRPRALSSKEGRAQPNDDRDPAPAATTPHVATTPPRSERAERLVV
jgi:hypothetical protein